MYLLVTKCYNNICMHNYITLCKTTTKKWLPNIKYPVISYKGTSVCSLIWICCVQFSIRNSLIKNFIANNADPDQTAGMCRLILFYTGHM